MAVAAIVFALIVVAIYGKEGWIWAWVLMFPFAFVAAAVAAIIRSHNEGKRYRRKYSKSKAL